MDIELASVTKRFGTRAALAGIDLSIAHGERVALVGPNGSGKSTLLRALMGLVRVEGRLRLAGADPFAERERVARELAYVPQVAPRLGATVGEIVRTVCTLRDMDENAVATLAARLELDLGPLARTPFATLSGGMKQKLLIALACARPASLSIFDEPTASLDAQTRARFDDLLGELTADGTVLLCTHRAEDVSRFATRVIELGEGRLVRDLRRAS